MPRRKTTSMLLLATLLGILGGLFVASPARALGNENGLARIESLLSRIADSLKDLSRNVDRNVCECRCK